MFFIKVSSDKKSILLIVDNSIYIYEIFENRNKYFYEHSNEITAFEFLPIKNLIVFTDSAKNLFLIDRGNNSILTKKLINKRAAKIIFTQDENVVILADKTGDVYTFDVDLENLETNQLKLLMGHLSMITDMILTSDEKYLITCDRDEKIRVSFFPNSYNIDSYLLEHKEFIIQAKVFCENQRLLSASGDSNLILWNLKDYKCLQKINIKNFIEKNLVEKAGIFQFDFNSETNLLILKYFELRNLILFKYSPKEDELVFLEHIILDRDIDYFISLNQNNCYLLVTLDQNTNQRFFIKKLLGNKLIDLDKENNTEKKFKSLEACLCYDVKFAESKIHKEELKAEYLSFFKAKVNNMSYYYDKKQERLNASSTLTFKRKHSNSNSSFNVQETKYKLTK